MIGIPPYEFPPIPLEDGITSSTTLDEALGLDMVGGWLNNEKDSMKSSCTWTNIGVLGSIKGGLNLAGRCSSTTSTSTNPASSNQKYEPSKSSSRIWNYFGGGFTYVIGSSPHNRGTSAVFQPR